jgi:hypothetical protein
LVIYRRRQWRADPISWRERLPQEEPLSTTSTGPGAGSPKRPKRQRAGREGAGARTPPLRRRLRRRLRRARRRFKDLRRRSRPEILYTYSFQVDPSKAGASPPGYRLVEADEARLSELKATYPKELSDRKLGILRARIGSQDERCWLITDADGTLCGYCHLTLASTLNARINHFVEVGASQAYFFDDFVFKRHRGRGLHGFSIARRLEILQGLGRTEVLITIRKDNKASLASFWKFGPRRRHRLVYLPPLRRTIQLPALADRRASETADPPPPLASGPT